MLEPMTQKAKHEGAALAREKAADAKLLARQKVEQETRQQMESPRGRMSNPSNLISGAAEAEMNTLEAALTAIQKHRQAAGDYLPPDEWKAAARMGTLDISARKQKREQEEFARNKGK